MRLGNNLVGYSTIVPAMLLCLPAILIIGELQSCPRRINSHWGALSKRVWLKVYGKHVVIQLSLSGEAGKQFGR